MNKNIFRLSFLAAFIITAISCNQATTTTKENDIDHFHSMLNNYWQGLLKLQPLDATMFSDSTMNDQFVNNCTQLLVHHRSSV